MTDSITVILAILPIHFAVMVSPGPNFVLLSTTALSAGRRDASLAALGIAVGSLVWMIAAAAGISVILEALPLLGMILKIVGGVYLVYLGYNLWMSKGLASEDVGALAISKGMSFWRGLIVNLTSPKSAAYFGSIFAAFLTDEVTIIALAFLIVSLFLVSIVWHVFLATTFSTEAVRRPYLQYSRIINRIAGTVLVAFGLKMAGSASAD